MAEGEMLFARIASSNKNLPVLHAKHDPDLTKAPEVLQWIASQALPAYKAVRCAACRYYLTS